MKFLFVSVNRSDYGIWRPILRLLKQKISACEIGIFATGGHLSKKHGKTIFEIHEDNLYDKLFEFSCTTTDDSPLGSSVAISKIPSVLGSTISSFLPDLICVLGDRYEVLTAALTASFFQIPIVHFHGGSITEGAIDDNFRHAITKLSHYHFVECLDYKKRIEQLGEEEENIHISGAPSLNELKHFKAMNKINFLEKFHLNRNQDFILVTLHSETTKSAIYNKKLALNLFQVLKETSYTILVTSPNPDPFSEPIFKEIEIRVKNNDVHYIPHLGQSNYFNAMNLCKFMVGNSSSGIIEAASFKKMVLNVGERQKNRRSDKNVLNCEISKKAIKDGLDKIEEKTKVKNFFKGWKSIYFQENSEDIILNFFKKHNQFYQKKFRNID